VGSCGPGTVGVASGRRLVEAAGAATVTVTVERCFYSVARVTAGVLSGVVLAGTLFRDRLQHALVSVIRRVSEPEIAVYKSLRAFSDTYVNAVSGCTATVRCCAVLHY
jgi:hypothetical protein